MCGFHSWCCASLFPGVCASRLASFTAGVVASMCSCSVDCDASHSLVLPGSIPGVVVDRQAARLVCEGRSGVVCSLPCIHFLPVLHIQLGCGQKRLAPTQGVARSLLLQVLSGLFVSPACVLSCVLTVNSSTFCCAVHRVVWSERSKSNCA